MMEFLIALMDENLMNSNANNGNEQQEFSGENNGSSYYSEASAPSTDEENEKVLTWAALPDILLEKVFSYLRLKDRYYASIVCWHWNDVFYSSTLWRKLVMTNNAFTHKRFTPHKGYWRELSFHKVQMCFSKVGAFIHTIEVRSMEEFYNLFHFIHIMNEFIEFHDEYPLQSFEKFYFTFACETRSRDQIHVYGTGGKLLEELKRLIGNLRKLEELRLNNLLLDLKEAPGVVDAVVIHCSATVKYLEIRNYTKELYPMFLAGMFPHLRTLVLSPQQLSNDVVAMLPSTSVTNLHLIQDHLVYEGYRVAKETWKRVGDCSPDLKVHLSAMGNTPLDINFQEGAPVASVTYTTKLVQVQQQAVDTISILYNTSLKLYGHYGLPRHFGSRSFESRCDRDIVSLVRTCHNLTTLVIRDRISTATLIIIAREGKKLQQLYVRRNALIKRCDWQKTLSWSEAYYQTMRLASLDYSMSFAEVSRCLGYRWEPMSDIQFKSLCPPNSGHSVNISDLDTS